MTPADLRAMFQDEMGERYITIDGAPNPRYVTWLEARVVGDETGMDPMKFAALIDRIGRKNDDEFTIRFSISHRSKSWQVAVVESAEGHHLIGGCGETPEAACAEALKGLCNALHSWGYEGL